MQHKPSHASRPEAASGPVAEARSSWPLLAACAWLVVFLFVAFRLGLPNNSWPDGGPLSRSQLWLETPSLLDLAWPFPPDASEPADSRFLREHSGWRYFPQRFDLLIVAAAILGGAWGVGGLLWRVVAPGVPAQGVERTVLTFALGLSAISLVTLGAGLSGWLSRPLLASLLGLALLIELAFRADLPPFARGGKGGSCPPTGVFLAWRDLPNPPSQTGGTTRQHRQVAVSFHWLWLVVLLPFLLAMLLGSLLPSTDFDVNEYHFQGPKEYFQNGRISFLPHNVYSSFPFGTEMLTLLAMVLRDDWYRGALAGKCVLMAFGPLTALGLFAAGRRWFGTSTGALAAVLYLTTPWVYRISTIAYAEGGLSFYLFASLFSLLLALSPREPSAERSAMSSLPPSWGKGWGWGDKPRWMPQDAPGPDPSPIVGEASTNSASSPQLRLFASPQSRFLLAGLFAGSAMACKYPGVVSVVIPLFAVVCARALRRRKQADAQSSPENFARRCLAPLAFGIGVLVTIGPWLLKNTVETGNPVYPLLYTIFDGRDWDAELNAKWRNGHKPPGYAVFSQNPHEMGLVYSVVDVAARNDWVNPLLFAFAPLTFLRRVRGREPAHVFQQPLVRWLSIYVGFLFVQWWLLTHRIDRFWVPMTPVVTLLAGAGGTALWNASSSPFRSLCRTLCVGAFLLVLPVNLLINVSPIGGYNDYLLDLDLAAQRAARITTPEIVHLNEHLPTESKVLSVGDAQVFDARFPIVYNTVFDRSIFEEWFAAETPPGTPAGKKPLRNPEEIHRKLHDEGITHIYVNWRVILRYRSPGNYGYTDFVTPARFAALQQAGVLDLAWAIPEARRPLSALDTKTTEELRRFAPELIFDSPNGPAYTTYQVFAVAPSGKGS